MASKRDGIVCRFSGSAFDMYARLVIQDKKTSIDYGTFAEYFSSRHTPFTIFRFMRFCLKQPFLTLLHRVVSCCRRPVCVVWSGAAAATNERRVV